MDKLVLGLTIVLLLTSCDAYLHMPYYVKNSSGKEVKLFIPNCPADTILAPFSKKRDTVVVLKPKEKIVVGYEGKIDFPWATKNIYRFKPGMCGVKKIDGDTMAFGCSKKEWKYKRKSSVLKIKNDT